MVKVVVLDPLYKRLALAASAMLSLGSSVEYSRTINGEPDFLNRPDLYIQTTPEAPAYYQSHGGGARKRRAWKKKRSSGK